MHRRWIILALCAAALCLCVASLRGEAPAKAADLRSALIGTWKTTSMKVDGQNRTMPDAVVTYKHVTPDGFTWLSYRKDTGAVFRCAGGTWTLQGDVYTENVEYGFGPDYAVIKNASHPFTCKIEGDTWHHTGNLANGMKVDEVLVRVRPSEVPKQEE